MITKLQMSQGFSPLGSVGIPSNCVSTLMTTSWPGTGSLPIPITPSSAPAEDHPANGARFSFASCARPGASTNKWSMAQAEGSGMANRSARAIEVVHLEAEAAAL